MRRTTTTVPGFSFEAVGRRLRDARKAAGLTQEEFAEASGFNKSSVIAWESGRNSPPAKMFACLRLVCNISPEWVLCGPGPKPLKDITPTQRDRTARAEARVRDLAQSHGLELSQEGIDDLTLLVINETEDNEEQIYQKMVPIMQAVAKAA